MEGREAKDFIFYKIEIDSFRNSFFLGTKSNKREIKKEITNIFFNDFYPNFCQRKNEVIEAIDKGVEKPLIIGRSIWFVPEEGITKKQNTALNLKAIKIKRETLYEEEKLKQKVKRELRKTIDLLFENFDFDTKRAGIEFRFSLIRRINRGIPTYSEKLFIQTFSMLIEKETVF